MEITEVCSDRNPFFGGLNPEPIMQNLGPLKDAVLAQKTPLELDLMRRLKSTFDPAGLLNPGVVLPGCRTDRTQAHDEGL